MHDVELRLSATIHAYQCNYAVFRILQYDIRHSSHEYINKTRCSILR